jgi:hypothetical protein
MLLTDYQRRTKDADLLESRALDASHQRRLLALGGKGSVLRTKHKLYLEIVREAVPFLPLQPWWHALELAPPLRSFTLHVLDPVDVVVSKLKRLHDGDLEDIEAMVTRRKVPHAALVERFRRAVDYFAYDARADDLPKIVANLHRVERDIFGVDESEVELPSWI